VKIVHTHSILATTHLSLLNERNMSAVESTQKAKTLLALKTKKRDRSDAEAETQECDRPDADAGAGAGAGAEAESPKTLRPRPLKLQRASSAASDDAAASVGPAASAATCPRSPQWRLEDSDDDEDGAPRRIFDYAGPTKPAHLHYADTLADVVPLATYFLDRWQRDNPACAIASKTGEEVNAAQDSLENGFDEFLTHIVGLDVQWSNPAVADCFTAFTKVDDAALAEQSEKDFRLLYLRFDALMRQLDARRKAVAIVPCASA
jgi:hypothetical protein